MFVISNSSFYLYVFDIYYCMSIFRFVTNPATSIEAAKASHWEVDAEDIEGRTIDPNPPLLFLEDSSISILVTRWRRWEDKAWPTGCLSPTEHKANSLPYLTNLDMQTYSKSSILVYSWRPEGEMEAKEDAIKLFTCEEVIAVSFLCNKETVRGATSCMRWCTKWIPSQAERRGTPVSFWSHIDDIFYIFKSTKTKTNLHCITNYFK